MPWRNSATCWSYSLRSNGLIGILIFSRSASAAPKILAARAPYAWAMAINAFDKDLNETLAIAPNVRGKIR